ncbi:MAG: PepSY domain-containing protein [Rhizomicrobium sp.]
MAATGMGDGQIASLDERLGHAGQMKELTMIRRTLLLTFAAGLATIGSVTFLTSHQSVLAANEDDAVLIKSLNTAKVSLQEALVTSEREGQPISGKFEAEDGKLQLSIYTAKDGKFFEVIVDHMNGDIGRVEPITEGEDLEHAKAQKAAMDRAKVTLAAAVAKANGYGTRLTLVSAVPDLKDGQPIVSIGFLKGEKLETVTEPLE